MCSCCYYYTQWEAPVWPAHKFFFTFLFIKNASLSLIPVPKCSQETTSGHYNIFVGDLSPEIMDSTLFTCFSVYSSCSDASVMWDQKTGRSRGFGFVSFRNHQDAQNAINDLNDDGHERSTDDSPENNPLYRTVYVGNLAPEVSFVELHLHFHSLGAGAIEDVRVQRDKGFGFVRYSTHAEAALAIQLGHSRILCGKPIKCSWGNKQTPLGVNSNPLHPPATALFPGFTVAELAAHQRQMALMHPSLPQAGLKQAAALGMGQAGPSRAINDRGFPGIATNQQLMLMYYY
ncbi:hypothetical protein SAY86_001604 [Trapa natans]|uniref:RRM domain-containing protein n=1 Tax=Trapa natans TaxID=22666 RepID=A0AAN7LP84_TRANT|nr:hypothetical protein SAY86_001604 [Trapa natans]